jgi:mono/diheme cytochrome c family protein
MIVKKSDLMKTQRLTGIFSLLLISMAFWACNNKGPGLEYMPDMYRSPAIDVYVDNNEYGNTEVKSVREPVKGTIPVGFQPFGIPNTPEGYEVAGTTLTNPFEATEANLAEGKVLYGYMCKHCHGAKGDGKGTITNPVYGAVPSYSDKLPSRRGGRSMSELKPGHIYHTIYYGLNAMGPHSSIISNEERWKIILYVQTLQGNDNVTKTEMVAQSGTGTEVQPTN